MSTPPVGWQRADRRALPGVGAIAVAAVLAGGPVGIVVGAATAVGWVLLASPYVAVLGGLSLLAVGVDGVAVGVGLVGVALVLVGPVAIHVGPVRTAVGTGVAALAIGVATWWVAATGGLLAGTVTLVVLVGAGGYTLHRYALVRIVGIGRSRDGGGHGE